MARQRFIWPTLWQDPDLGRVSPLAALLYIGCFSNADDDGRMIGEAAFLRSAVFPYRKLTDVQVEKLRDELAATCSNFVVYEKDGNAYIAFTNWNEWQKPKYPKPSKLPPPPGKRRRDKAPQSQKSSGKHSGKSSVKTSEALGEASGIGLGRVGLGREEHVGKQSVLSYAGDEPNAEPGLPTGDEAWAESNGLTPLSALLEEALERERAKVREEG